ncbi:hypothetical protein [Jiulongibacter sp. NS-SX5]|uniref:hypothetical protein n=1 Tax=Jiulongibacter sp. NS-SX5 TaxID=3463854 RepID=UPI00405877B1
MKWPEKWEDLSANTIRKVVPLVWQMKYAGDDYDQVILIGRALIHAFQPQNSRLNLTEKEVLLGLNKLLWLLNTDITTRPFDYVKVAGKKRYLPRENFEDTDAIEMAMTNFYYLQFASAASASPQEDTKETVGDAYRYLWILLAMICRPRVDRLTDRFWRPFSTSKESQRVEFDNDEAEKVAMEFSKLPIGVCLAILNYWEAQQKVFMEQYSNVLKGEGGEPLFANGEGWIASLEDVAKDGVHGDFERVCSTNCHTIWTYLSHQKTIADAQVKANKK